MSREVHVRFCERPEVKFLRPTHPYIPMARGFVYLAVVLDWFSRRVLSWRLSITMEAAFCVAALEDALARHGKPDIFNTDQGSQFTGVAFTGVLANNDIAISMDGKGAWRDNVFVERLWRNVKYEEVYLRAYDSVSEARASIGRYLDFYNGRRPHSSLDGTTPDQATSPRCQSAWKPNPGRRSTYRRGKSVQTTGPTSTSRGMKVRIVDAGTKYLAISFSSLLASPLFGRTESFRLMMPSRHCSQHRTRPILNFQWSQLP